MATPARAWVLVAPGGCGAAAADASAAAVTIYRSLFPARPFLFMVAPFARTSQSHSHVTHFLRGFSTAIVGLPPLAPLCLQRCLWYCNVHNRIFMTPSLRLATPEPVPKPLAIRWLWLRLQFLLPAFTVPPPIPLLPPLRVAFGSAIVPSLVTKSCEFYRPDVREVCVACGLSGFAWDHEFHTMVMAALALTTRVYCPLPPPPTLNPWQKCMC